MSVQVISFKCLLKNKAGKVISFTYNRDVINAPDGEKAGLHGLVAGLQNIQAGEHRTVALSAAEAYGFYDPKKVITYPRRKISGHVKVGTKVFLKNQTGRTAVYKVLHVEDSLVKLDGNHPLAGQDLIFEIEAISVRPALPEDIEEITGRVVGLN